MKVLGIVASVIGILAFFGIANYDDLKDALSSGKDPDEAVVGDCIDAVADGEITVVSCEQDSADYKVVGRLPYDSMAYDRSPNPPVVDEDPDAFVTCINAGYYVREQFVIANGGEVLCVEEI
ncbi:hypothetical protein [Stackebrandtia soli]|uniref:hypothetical protein n=1 Tax=Stackebrandtia soli TaxID=1892856 RepID=UPI0039EC0042